MKNFSPKIVIATIKLILGLNLDLWDLDFSPHKAAQRSQNPQNQAYLVQFYLYKLASSCALITECLV